MPSSNLALAPELVALVAELRPRTVVDVGPGNGKYGVLCREYCGHLRRLIAIEGEPRYLTAFPWLEAIYDEVIVIDAIAAPDRVFTAADVVIMADVIEHLTLDDGAALLRRINRPVVVSTPEVFFQNPEADAGYETERHRSLWTRELFDDPELTGHRIIRDSAFASTIGGILVRLDPA